MRQDNQNAVIMDDRIVSHSYIHAIFSTKNQQPVLLDDVREELCHFIGGALQDIRCPAVELYVGVDHVHLLYRQSDQISVDACVNAVKKVSVEWLQTRGKDLRCFEWQESYGAFSVGGPDVGELSQHLRDQHEYHLIRSFEDEYRELLRENGIEFDEKDIWD